MLNTGEDHRVFHSRRGNDSMEGFDSNNNNTRENNMAKRTKEQQEAINAKAKATREANKKANKASEGASEAIVEDFDADRYDKVYEKLKDVKKLLFVVDRTAESNRRMREFQLYLIKERIDHDVKDWMTRVDVEGKLMVRWICTSKLKGYDKDYFKDYSRIRI